MVNTSKNNLLTWETVSEEFGMHDLVQGAQGHFVTRRMKVEGGFLYRFTSVHSTSEGFGSVSTAMVFVPETKTSKRTSRKKK